MAKRRKSTKRRKTTARRNPSKRRTYRSRAVSRARSTFNGLNIKGALKNQIPMLAGMFGAKFAAKKFGESASETDPGTWNYMSYIKAGIGAVATAFVAQNIKRGSGQKVLEGGLAYVAFKLVQNELIANNTWASEQFGAEEYYPSEYLEGYGDDDDDYEPGEIATNSVGEPYLLGDDYQWQKLPEGSMSGPSAMKPVGRLGSVMQQVGPLGMAPGSDDVYRKALLQG